MLGWYTAHEYSQFIITALQRADVPLLSQLSRCSFQRRPAKDAPTVCVAAFCRAIIISMQRVAYRRTETMVDRWLSVVVWANTPRQLVTVNFHRWRGPDSHRQPSAVPLAQRPCVSNFVVSLSCPVLSSRQPQSPSHHSNTAAVKESEHTPWTPLPLEFTPSPSYQRNITKLAGDINSELGLWSEIGLASFFYN